MQSTREYQLPELLCVAVVLSFVLFLYFFFNDTATTELYTLSLHDALPISRSARTRIPSRWSAGCRETCWGRRCRFRDSRLRSEEHTSELQSPYDLVCRLLLEKKKKITRPDIHTEESTIL